MQKILRAFIAVAFLSFVPLLALAQYTPRLFKTPTTTGLVIVDCKKDRFGPTLQASGATWRNFEVTLALRTIQGIVNRTSATKIYLLNLAYTPNSYYPNNIEQDFLDDDIVPLSLPRTTATLDNTKTYPALHYLLTNYASFLTGKVVMSDITQNTSGFYTGDDLQIFAAITAAAQLNAVPVSTSLATYLSGQGFSLTTQADVSGLSGTAAWTWALNNYFNANTTRTFIARQQLVIDYVSPNLKPDYPVTQIDYFVAARAFIDALDTNNATQLGMLSQLYTTSKYAAATPTLGRSNEDRNVEDRGLLGYPHAHLHGPNFSVLSSFPSIGANLSTSPVPTVHSYTNNTVFVGFYVTDGDNISFSNNKYYYRIKNSADRGARAVSFGVNPLLFELNPRLLEYYSDMQANPANQLSYPANMMLCPGLGFDFTGTAWNAWATWANNLLGNTNGLFRGYNMLAGGYENLTKLLNIDYSLWGYRGPGTPSTTAPQLQMIDGRIPSSFVHTNAPETETGIRYFVTNSDNTKPLFIVASIGDSSTEPFGYAKTIAANLEANPQGKVYKFVSVADVLATYKAWVTNTPQVSDNFEDGNYTANPVWTTSGGTWSVATTTSTKRLKQTATGTISGFIVLQNSGGDYSHTVTCRINSVGSGSSTLVVGGRWVDSNNRYNVAYYPATQQLKLVKRVNGTATDLATKSYTMATGTDYTIRFYVKGNSLRAYVNGILELSATDSALTTGKPYVATYNLQAEFDDVLQVNEP